MRKLKRYFWNPKFGWHATYMVPYLYVMSKYYRLLYRLETRWNTPRPKKTPELNRLRELAGIKKK